MGERRKPILLPCRPGCELQDGPTWKHLVLTSFGRRDDRVEAPPTPPSPPFVLLLLWLIKESICSESEAPRWAELQSPHRPGWLAGWGVIGRRRGRGLSVAGGGDDADVQEVVWVAEVLAEPLQRRLQQRLDAVDHHLVALVLTCRGDKEVFSSFHVLPKKK